MKYTTPLLLALMLAISMPGAFALVDASLQRYDPTPAQPGDLLTVYIGVTNDAVEITRGVELEILPTSTIIPEGQAILNVGTLSEVATYTGTLKVRVASDAPAGDAVLRMRVRENGGDWQEETGIITIQGIDSAAIISNVEITPETVQPGKTATVTLTVENNADTILRDITTELTLDDTPFVPKESSSRQKINELAADESAKITYKLAAQPTATADYYRVPVTLSFLNEQGETQEDADVFGLAVTTDAATTAIVDDITRSESGVDVAVRIINKGLSEIKFVEAAVAQTEGYSIPTEQQVAYVGNIDSDDWETMRFSVSTEQDSVSVPLSYSFQDAFNNEIVVEQTLEISIPEQQQGGSSSAIIVVVLILVVAGVWLLRRRNKKFKKKK